MRAVYPPEVYVRDMLWLDRMLSVEAAWGARSQAFRVAAMTDCRGTHEVLALEARVRLYLWSGGVEDAVLSICARDRFSPAFDGVR